ncbi:HEPN domain-containing protein [Patescibacteria group bacterium]|nr:HEPN domain-containing protein [Patescibacteria group bacterium]
MVYNFKPPEEWFKQADYDLDTAEVMLKTGRYIYAVFMCHLSIEKKLKGLYVKKFKKSPPKIHNLNYFCEKIGLVLPETLQDFTDKLNSISVPTRYPDELEKLLKDYKKDLIEGIFNQTKELVLWLKQKK